MIVKEGFVYILVSMDPAHENRIKVGFSNNPYRRCKELSGTSVAYPFKIYCAWAVEDMRAAEYAAHYMLRMQRVTSNREFFDIIPVNDLSVFLSEFVSADSGMSKEDLFRECVWILRERIDDAFKHSMFRSYEVEVAELEEYAKQKKITDENPDNPNRFLPLF